MDLLQYLNETSTETNNKIEIVEKQLRNSPEGGFREEFHDGKYYYVQDYYTKRKRCRHSLTRDEETFEALIRKEIFKKELTTLKANKEAVDYVLPRLKEFTIGKAVKELMSRYPHLPEERILAALANQGVASQLGQTPQNAQVPQNPQAVLNLHNPQSVQAPAAEWANAEYERSTYRQEDLRQITTRGLKVRSKSEAMIAEKLYQYNQQFRYEQVLRVNDFSLVPDFIIRRSDGKLFYWEHMGLTNNRLYLDRQMQKLQQYASVSIVPWDNLIITFDNEGGMIDLRRVEFEIQNRLL